ETDHPDTLRQRRALVGEDGVEMKALRLPDQLDDLAALCALRPTTIICEGLLMYLPRREAWRALRFLAALPRPPRLVFTALDTTLPGGRGFRRPASLVRRWLARQGEPFRWRSCPGQLRTSLAAVGYAVTRSWDGNGYGEYAIVAEPRR
ncbi:MAG TPA: hypothetical protein VFY00_03020, partial [Arenimonas sp.]|nr:hypothetical protein [Arenimonas sp.]